MEELNLIDLTLKFQVSIHLKILLVTNCFKGVPKYHKTMTSILNINTPYENFYQRKIKYYTGRHKNFTKFQLEIDRSSKLDTALFLAEKN